MSRVLIRALIGLWALWPLLAYAQEDESDQTLSLYTTINDILQDSEASLANAPEDASASLTLAFETFERWQRDLGNISAVGNSVSATFERAQDAITNRSAIDLSVQVAVIKGGLQRLLYESAVTEAEQGSVATAQERFKQLVRDAELSALRADELAEIIDDGYLQEALELANSERMASQLERARDLVRAGENSAAYRELAHAYSAFIPVQDSPNVSSTMGDTLISAITAVVADQPEVQTKLDDLDEEVRTFAEASQTGLDTAREAANTLTGAVPEDGSQGEVVVTDTPQPEGQQDAATVAVPVAPDPVAPAVAEPSAPDEGLGAVAPALPADVGLPADTPAVGLPGDTSSVAPAIGSPLDPAVPEVPATFPGSSEGSEGQVTDPNQPGFGSSPSTLPPTEAPNLDLLARQLQQRLSSRQTDLVLSQYARLGMSSIDDALAMLNTHSARLSSAVLAGDQGGAAAAVDAYEELYSALLEPIIARNDTVLADSTRNLLARLEGEVVYRVQDSVALAEQANALNASIRNIPLGVLAGLRAMASQYWGGWLRFGVMVFLALLALVPLFLSGVAFGGGHRPLIQLGWGLGLLLIPLILEGLSYLGAWLSNWLSMPMLDLLTGFAPSQSALGYALWALLSLFAILSSISGLRGLSKQLGLIGSSKATITTFDEEDEEDEVPPFAAPPLPKQSEGPVAGAARGHHVPPTMVQHTMVDWDEEF